MTMNKELNFNRSFPHLNIGIKAINYSQSYDQFKQASATLIKPTVPT